MGKRKKFIAILPALLIACYCAVKGTLGADIFFEARLYCGLKQITSFFFFSLVLHLMCEYKFIKNAG